MVITITNTSTYSPFLDLAYLKHAISSPDNIDDGALSLVIADACQEIDTRLAPYTNTPMPQGHDMFPQCRGAALAYAKYLWWEDQNILEKSEHNSKIFDGKMESIISELKSRKTSKTTSILISRDPLKDIIQLPTQYPTGFFLD